MTRGLFRTVGMLAALGVLAGTAAGSSKKSTKSAKAAKASKKKHAVNCSLKKNKGKNGCGTGEWGTFHGHGIAASELRTEALPHPSGKLDVKVENFSEDVSVNLYTPAGGFDAGALGELDHAFRCKRTGTERQIDPRLFEILSLIEDHFGKPISLVSGYRNQRNQNSRHFHGSAADIHLEGVSDADLRDYVQSLVLGGMGIGIYPTSGFIHVDFRAPGRPSFRWVDTSTSEQQSPGKQPPRGFTNPNT